MKLFRPFRSCSNAPRPQGRYSARMSPGGESPSEQGRILNRPLETAAERLGEKIPDRIWVAYSAGQLKSTKFLVPKPINV
jgi:hypothetical protein